MIGVILQRYEPEGSREHTDSRVLIRYSWLTEELPPARALSYLSDASFDVPGFLYCLSANDSPGLTIMEMMVSLCH